MVNLDLAHSVEEATTWFAKNEALLIQYAVNIIAAIVILLVGFVIARFFSNAINRVMMAKGVDRTVGNFLATLIRYAILAFVFIAALGRVGVQTASIIAMLGAAGLAVGLALQGSLSNFAAGVLLVIFRPFRAGEYITVGSVSGTVDNVQIFSTTLRSSDNKTIVVPNGKIIAGEIINFSRQPERRIEMVISVAYDADIDRVKAVLNAVIDADKRIIKEKGVTVRLNEMAASSLNFAVQVWAKNSDYWAVYYDLMETFKKTLDEHQIGIPYPQMDVHFHRVVPQDKQESSQSS